MNIRDRIDNAIMTERGKLEKKIMLLEAENTELKIMLGFQEKANGYGRFIEEMREKLKLESIDLLDERMAEHFGESKKS